MKQTAIKQIKDLARDGRELEVGKDLLLTAFAEQGIKSLDDVAQHALRAFAAAQPRPSGELAPGLDETDSIEPVVDLLFGKAAQDNAKDCTHSPPKLPFVLGRRTYRANEVARFNGKPLHYIWDRELLGQGLMRAAIDPAEYRERVERAVTLPQSGAEILPQHHVPGRGHSFYQHINYGGNVLNLAYRHAHPDLTSVTMSGWWFWATSWNDQISSLRTGSGQVLLGEHVMRPYLTGATMTIVANSSVPWIGAAWNDRVSCILG